MAARLVGELPLTSKQIDCICFNTALSLLFIETISVELFEVAMTKVYRNGPVGALVDEYERASAELAGILKAIDDADFELVRDTKTSDEDCRSIQTIMSHVVRSGYGYANRARKALSVPVEPYVFRMLSRSEVLPQLDSMLAYTARTFDDRWHYTNDQILDVQIESQWGPENLEQLLEHAIVHILRHRRQIERFLAASSKGTMKEGTIR